MTTNGPGFDRSKIHIGVGDPPPAADGPLPVLACVREQLRDPLMARRFLEKMLAAGTAQIVASRDFVDPVSLLAELPGEKELAAPEIQQLCGDAARWLGEWCHQHRYPQFTEQYMRRAGELLAFAREEQVRIDPRDIHIVVECATAESNVLCRLGEVKLAEQLLLAERKRLGQLLVVPGVSATRVAGIAAANIEVLYALRFVYQVDRDSRLAEHVGAQLRDAVETSYGKKSDEWAKLLRIFGRDALNFGSQLADSGRSSEANFWFGLARDHFRERLTIVCSPDRHNAQARAEAESDLGIALLQLQELPEAEEHTRAAYDLMAARLADSPALLVPYVYNMMMVLEAQGRTEDAQVFRTLVERIEGTAVG